MGSINEYFECRIYYFGKLNENFFIRRYNLPYLILQIFSTKLLGKRPNIKLKNVTIMHNQPTETVKLPNSDGQVTVHPQLRSKLPLKKKVRNGKKIKRKHKGKESLNNNVHSPKKSKVSPKKKKRVSAAVGAEENRKKSGEAAAVIEIPPSKVKRSQQSNVSKKKKKKKEVIDYSSAQNDQDGKKGLTTVEVVHNPVTPEVTDPVGKVQNWLLKSHHSALPKSKSTPAGLTDKTSRSPHKRPTIRPKTDKSKSHSIGNLPSDKDKVRLQVVYKPPFKFSVKLKKPDKTVPVVKPKSRTAVLVRTVKEREAKFKKNTVKPSEDPVIAAGIATSPLQVNKSTPKQPNPDDIDSNIHTVQSDLEVLLSESEFLFSAD